MNIQRILVSLLLLISTEGYCQESSNLDEIYNFEVGDEFQMLEFYYTDTGEYIIKRKVITYKEIEMDKITYIQFNTKYDILGSNYPPFQLAFLEYYFDTLVINYPDSIIFSNTPPNSVYNDPNLYNGRKINKRWYYITNSTIIDIFADGCGLVEYHISEAGHNFLRDSLLYYKKGEETWGNSAILDQQENIYSTSVLQLYPNPVEDFLSIHVENSTQPNQILI